MKIGAWLTILALAGGVVSCAPCREVRIESNPTGAAVYARREDPMPSLGMFPVLRWENIGTTPLIADSCYLSTEIKARWDEEELFFIEPHGKEKILFDFEQGTVSESTASENPMSEQP